MHIQFSSGCVYSGVCRSWYMGKSCKQILMINNIYSIILFVCFFHVSFEMHISMNRIGK